MSFTPFPCKSTGIKGWVFRNPPFTPKAPKLRLPLLPFLRCNPPLPFFGPSTAFSLRQKLLQKCTLPHLKTYKIQLSLPIRDRQDVSFFVFSGLGQKFFELEFFSGVAEMMLAKWARYETVALGLHPLSYTTGVCFW